MRFALPSNGDEGQEKVFFFKVLKKREQIMITDVRVKHPYNVDEVQENVCINFKNA